MNTGESQSQLDTKNKTTRKKCNRKLEIIGWIGSIGIIVSYFLVSQGFLDGTGLIYNVMAAGAATCLAIRVAADKNWSNLVLQVVFVGIGVFAIAKALF